MDSKAFAGNGSKYAMFSMSHMSGGVGKIREHLYAQERDALTARISDYNVRIAESVSDGKHMSALAYCRWKNHYQRAFETCRNEFIASNLALQFLSFSKWVKRQGGIPAGQRADEILSNAHNSLIRAAELFDPAKGRFSTYCVRALLRTFDRGNQKEKCALSRITSLRSAHVSPIHSPYLEAVAAEEREINRARVQRALGYLSSQERDLIHLRFGVNSGNQRPTHRQIGKSWGTVHQRSWQVEKSALAKLRKEIGDIKLVEYNC